MGQGRRKGPPRARQNPGLREHRPLGKKEGSLGGAGESDAAGRRGTGESGPRPSGRDPLLGDGTMAQKLFGTDGIRGMANEFPMTGEVAMAVGRAIAFVLNKLPGAEALKSRKVGKPLESRKSVRRARIVVGK